MTTTDTVPAWPKIDATVRSDGTGYVTINGTSHPIEETSLDRARAAVLARVAETAAKVGRPVRVATSSPDGDYPLIVHPDGSVDADPSAEARPAAPPEVSAVVVEPDAAAVVPGAELDELAGNGHAHGTEPADPRRRALLGRARPRRAGRRQRSR